MFRKPFQEKSQSHVKTSEKRRIREDLLRLYPSLTTPVDKDNNNGSSKGLLIDLILPNKEPLLAIKIETHSGVHGTIYVDETHQPLFFKLEGDLVPTVYTLWKFQGKAILGRSMITNSGAFTNISKGADLMLPGLYIPETGLPPFKVNDVVSILLYPSSVASAVGTALCNSDEYVESNYTLKGKACAILHCYGDTLWAFGDQTHPPLMQDTKPDLDLNESIQENHTQGNGNGSTQVNDNGNQEGENDGHSPSMDDLLELALLMAIQACSKAKAYPLTSSVFYDTFMMSSKPYSLSIEVKASSFKKVTKFLKAYEKKGILKLKDKGSEVMVMGANETHLLFNRLDDLPSVPKEKVKSVEPSAMKILIFYEVNHKTSRFFAIIGEQNQRFSLSQLRKLLLDYYKTNDLVDLSVPRIVQLDEILASIVLSKKDEPVSYLTKEVLLERFVDAMQPYYEIEFPDASMISRKGKLDPILIQIEQRMGRKRMTKITNLESYQIDVYTMLDYLKHKCASSTTLEDVAGKKDLMAVLVQGNMVKEVMQALVSFGIPFDKKGLNSEFVLVQDKTKKK